MNRPGKDVVSNLCDESMFEKTRKFTRLLRAEQRGEAGVAGAKCLPFYVVR
jgi:hypothetical protein